MKQLLCMCAAFLLLPPAGAEKPISKFPDKTLSREDRKGGIIQHAFYVFKTAPNYRGKKLSSRRISSVSPVHLHWGTTPGFRNIEGFGTLILAK